jgi:hypothetical protein
MRLGEGVAKLAACGDAGLRKYPVEVGADGAVGEVELQPDLAVGESARGHFCARQPLE